MKLFFSVVWLLIVAGLVGRFVYCRLDELKDWVTGLAPIFFWAFLWLSGMALTGKAIEVIIKARE